ncbi:hypothetical protein ACFLYX_02080 [Chloroflexota bacterium]
MIVASVTSVTTIAALGITTVLGAAAAITLMVFLATRELANANRRSTIALRIAKFAGVGILPLIMAFATVVIVEITKIL